MRLRVLLTNGTRTIDLIWLAHNGTDVYYGYVNSTWKSSYHEKGQRHSKSVQGDYSRIESHCPLKEFKGQLQLCCFGFCSKIVESTKVADFSRKKSDAILYLDTRTLPETVNISLGFLEPGNYNAILPVHEHSTLRQIFLVTNTVPWIYLMVLDVDKMKNYGSNNCSC